jgi:hypothetical protein
MNERTKWIYIYRHDGGDYIGCRAQGRFVDCYAYETHEVDCTKCKHNKEVAYEDTCAGRRAQHRSI